MSEHAQSPWLSEQASEAEVEFDLAFEKLDETSKEYTLALMSIEVIMLSRMTRGEKWEALRSVVHFVKAIGMRTATEIILTAAKERPELGELRNIAFFHKVNGENVHKFGTEVRERLEKIPDSALEGIKLGDEGKSSP